MSVDDEKKQKALENFDSMCASLAGHSPLMLTVGVQDREEAKQILDWLYSKTPPMKANLLNVAWDQETVTKLEAEAVRMIRDGVRDEIEGGA